MINMEKKKTNYFVIIIASVIFGLVFNFGSPFFIGCFFAAIALAGLLLEAKGSNNPGIFYFVGICIAIIIGYFAYSTYVLPHLP